MAKTSYRLARLADCKDIIDGWPMPSFAQLLALPYDAAAPRLGESHGCMQANTIETFKIADAAAFGNVPQIVRVTLKIERLAADEAEDERIARAYDDQQARTGANKAKRAEEIERSNSATLEAFSRGQQVQAQIVASVPKPKVAEQVKEALTLASVIASVAPKQITTGS